MILPPPLDEVPWRVLGGVWQEERVGEGTGRCAPVPVGLFLVVPTSSVLMSAARRLSREGSSYRSRTPRASPWEHGELFCPTKTSSDDAGSVCTGSVSRATRCLPYVVPAGSAPTLSRAAILLPRSESATLWARKRRAGSVLRVSSTVLNRSEDPSQLTLSSRPIHPDELRLLGLSDDCWACGCLVPLPSSSRCQHDP